MVVGTTGNATLLLQNNSNFGQPAPNVPITLGQNAGIQGTLTIGNGGNGAGVGYASVTTGAGSGVINFNEASAFESSSTTYPFYPTISGNIAVIQNGNATTLLSPAGANTYTGGTVVNAGTIQLASANALPSAGGIEVNGGTFDLTGFSVPISSLSINAGVFLTSMAGGEASVSNSITTGGGTLSAPLSGTAALTQNGSGTTTVSGANTYSGGTNVVSGTLVLGSAAALPAGGNLTVSGGTMDLNGQSVGLLGALTVSGGTLSSSGGPVSLTPSSTTTMGGSIEVELTGSSSLTQQGAGTTTSINTPSSFTGATAINGGTLLLDTIGALGGTSSVSLTSSGTLLLAASNSVNDAASFDFNGGTLLMSSDLGEALGATTVTQESIIDLGGSSVELTFATLSINAPLEVWNWTPSQDFLFLGSSNFSGNLSLIQFYSDSGNNAIGAGQLDGLQIVPVPEPATPVLLLIAAGGIGAALRMKRSFGKCGAEEGVVAKADLF